MEYQPVTPAIDQGNYLSFRPGARLKKARENAGLTIAQVADRLKILPRVLQAIEADDYKSLPEPVYVRGYLRLYAALVVLPADDIVARFDEYYLADRGQQPSIVSPTKLFTPLPVFVPRRLPVIKAKTMIGLLLTAVVLIGAVAVWQSHLVEKMGLWRQQLPNAVSVSTNATPSVNTIPLENTATTLQAVDSLALSFSADTQVIIHDASGTTLTSGLKKAGDTLTVTGQSPFAIELNPAAAVQFRFNNQPIDLKPYTVNGIVNFRLSR